MNSPVSPFSCSFSPQIPELLQQLNCSIVFSTYQAGKVVVISAPDSEKLSILPRTFDKAMGIGIRNDEMVIACKEEVVKLRNSPELAEYYPNQPGKYDSLFVPRATYYTGRVDIHDVELTHNEIWAVNTTFSCLVTIDDKYSFTPKWKPPFITDLVSEDRCHLNGLVIINEQPKYVTALGKTNTPQGWRNNITSGGLLMDVQTNQIILERLAMPHSPVFYNNELYLLQSANGTVIKVNIAEKKYDIIRELECFCRGMSIYKDYMFIGMSKLRQNSSTFAHLSFAEKSNLAGIKILHLPTRSFVGEIVFKASVDEIYDVKILANTIKPNILNTINDVHKYSLHTPNKTFWSSLNSK